MIFFYLFYEEITNLSSNMGTDKMIGFLWVKLKQLEIWNKTT